MLFKLRYHIKLARLTAHVLRGFFICFFFFPWIKKESKKTHIQRWSQQLLAILKVHININLTNEASNASLNSIIISNHVSWMDIFVINSLTPCRFVAKSDIRSWPLLGWLAERGGTVYISRGNRADVRRIYKHLIEHVEAGDRVAFFPEGTTSKQGTLLPFHANLFEAAIHAQVPIQPIALRYLNAAGELHSSVEFIGDISVATSLKNVLSQDEIRVELNGLGCVSSEGVHRRELATISRKMVALALQVPFSDEKKMGSGH